MGNTKHQTNPPSTTKTTATKIGVVAALGVATLAVACSVQPQQLAVPTSASRAEREAPPNPLRGVTLDSVTDLDTTMRLLQSSPKKLTVRLVLDPGEDLTAYQHAAETLHSHAYVMAQVLDSEEMAAHSEQAIRQRTQRALELFGEHVDIWEIGNELNGAWVGTSPEDINTKATAASKVIKHANGKTAITLNYWSSPDCYAEPWEATVAYAETMPASLRASDYVLLSIYETACDPPQHPSAKEVAATLTQLGQLFPQAQLGIGETGVQNANEGRANDGTLAEKQALASYYYGMHSELSRLVGSRYIGGYFWWYFHEDAVAPLAEGRADSLWPTLERLTADL